MHGSFRPLRLCVRPFRQAKAGGTFPPALPGPYVPRWDAPRTRERRAQPCVVLPHGVGTDGWMRFGVGTWAQKLTDGSKTEWLAHPPPRPRLAAWLGSLQTQRARSQLGSLLGHTVPCARNLRDRLNRLVSGDGKRLPSPPSSRTDLLSRPWPA